MESSCRPALAFAAAAMALPLLASLPLQAMPLVGAPAAAGGLGGPASGLGVRPGAGLGAPGAGLTRAPGVSPAVVPAAVPAAGGLGGPASGLGVRPGPGVGGIGIGR